MVDFSIYSIECLWGCNTCRLCKSNSECERPPVVSCHHWQTSNEVFALVLGGMSQYKHGAGAAQRTDGSHLIPTSFTHNKHVAVYLRGKYYCSVFVHAWSSQSIIYPTSLEFNRQQFVRKAQLMLYMKDHHLFPFDLLCFRYLMLSSLSIAGQNTLLLAKGTLKNLSAHYVVL